MAKQKYCEYCKKLIAQNNFTTHKNTNKHIKNKENYKQINILELKDINNAKYLKLQLEEIKNNIDNILNNIK